MDVLKTAKAICVAAFGLLSSWLGILAIPVYVLVACNVMDYITGLAASAFLFFLISISPSLYNQAAARFSFQHLQSNRNFPLVV